MISSEERALQPENLGPYARQNFLGPNLLDEEAAVKFAMGMSSLTSPGFTRLSNESGLFAFTYCRNFRDESVRVFHQCLASSTGRRTIDTGIFQPILLSSCRAWCRMENA